MKGIYKITQKSTNKVYIGQSINIDNRWNQHAFTIDNLSFHAEYRKNPTDFIFEVLVQDDNYTKEDLDRLEKYYINDYHSNDSKYGFNATKGNGKDQRAVSKQRMLMVRGSIDKYINSKFLRHIENKKILIIGNFNIGESSLYNDITVLTDDFDYTCDTAKIIRVEGGEEIMAQLNMMKDEKFDVIIANPPYNMGNQIISNCVDKAEETIVLMPFSKYKANNLYKHVLSLEIVDPKSFKDATITNNLCVCKLIKNEINRTFEELELETFDQNYREFYELNAKMPNKLSYTHGKYIKLLSEEQLSRTFYISVRVNLDGVHHSKAFDIDANNGIISIEELNADAEKRKKTATTPLSSIEFKTKKEADNIKRFWYNSTFLSDLIWGLKKEGGSCAAAIPNIDWSIDRDYEHLTYEQLLAIMKEELKKA